MEKLKFILDSGEEVEFEVIEETRVNGVNYLLVTDSADGEDGDAYILKDTSEAIEEEATYEFVEDETELEAVFKIFNELLEEIDIEM